MKLLYREIGNCYQVMRDFEIQTIMIGHQVLAEQYTLFTDGLLIIKKYYCWDGPSGAVNTKTFVKSSCVHDVFCEMINAGLIPMEDQKVADAQMMLINDEQKMWPPRRLWTYAAVRYYQGKKKVLAGVPKIHEV